MSFDMQDYARKVFGMQHDFRKCDCRDCEAKLLEEVRKIVSDEYESMAKVGGHGLQEQRSEHLSLRPEPPILKAE
jgi:hypothetical protein